ncbi:hypothetical protein DB347_06270 [Opitutaceae bacterium EW11]|nr:hypothetical protein DB347_06270 [Opitutaceae bacterium EW11]
MAALIQIWKNAVLRSGDNPVAPAPHSGSSRSSAPAQAPVALAAVPGPLDTDDPLIAATLAFLQGRESPGNAAPLVPGKNREGGLSLRNASPESAPSSDAPRLVPTGEDVPAIRSEIRDGRDDAGIPAADEVTLGAAVLQSFLQQGTPAVAPSAALPAVQAAPRIQNLDAIVADTVSRLLVSDPLHDGRREVRIALAPSVLPDTEVRLWREEGRLHVEFTSPPAVADSGLQDALPRLGEAIHQRAPQLETPVVTLRVQDGQTGGQPQDGRSRQQYQPIGDAEDLA